MADISLLAPPVLGKLSPGPQPCRSSSSLRGAGVGAQHQLFAHLLPPPGPGDTSSKPALLLPTEDGEDSASRTHGLLEEGAVLGHGGGGESQQWWH